MGGWPALAAPREGLSDAGASSVEGLGEGARLLSLIGLARDDGGDAALSRRLPVGLAGLALAADRRARPDVGSRAGQDRRMRRTALPPAGRPVGSKAVVRPSRSVLGWILAVGPPRGRPGA